MSKYKAEVFKDNIFISKHSQEISRDSMLNLNKNMLFSTKSMVNPEKNSIISEAIAMNSISQSIINHNIHPFSQEEDQNKIRIRDIHQLFTNDEFEKIITAAAKSVIAELRKNNND